MLPLLSLLARNPALRGPLKYAVIGGKDKLSPDVFRMFESMGEGLGRSGLVLRAGSREGIETAAVAGAKSFPDLVRQGHEFRGKNIVKGLTDTVSGKSNPLQPGFRMPESMAPAKYQRIHADIRRQLNLTPQAELNLMRQARTNEELQQILSGSTFEKTRGFSSGPNWANTQTPFPGEVSEAIALGRTMGGKTTSLPRSPQKGIPTAQYKSKEVKLPDATPKTSYSVTSEGAATQGVPAATSATYGGPVELMTASSDPIATALIRGVFGNKLARQATTSRPTEALLRLANENPSALVGGRSLGNIRDRLPEARNVADLKKLLGRDILDPDPVDFLTMFSKAGDELSYARKAAGELDIPIVNLANRKTISNLDDAFRIPSADRVRIQQGLDELAYLLQQPRLF